jgi:hypothetical protein
MATRGTLYQDPALEQASIAYKNADLIAEMIMPTLNVKKQSGKIYKFGKEAFKIPASRRAPGVVSNRILSYSVSTDSYYCDSHALHDVINREDKANADKAIQPEIATTEGVTDTLMLRREYDLASLLFSTTTFSGYTSTLTGDDQWSSTATSDPIANARTASENIRQNTGTKPNVCIMGATVWKTLVDHPKILERTKYIGKDPSNARIAELFGVKKILVGNSVYNTAAEGATESMGDIWGDYCLFAYIAETPGMRKPSMGYSYNWSVGTKGTKVYREELKPSQGHGTFIEVEKYYDDVVTAAEFGYLYADLIA